MMDEGPETCTNEENLASECFEIVSPRKLMPWYKANTYQRFWKMYQSCMFYAHKDAYSRCVEIEDNTAATLYNMVKAPWPGRPPLSINSSSRQRRKKCSRKSRKNRKLKEKRKKKKQLKSVEVENCFVLTDDDTLQVQLREGMQLGGSSQEEGEEDVDKDFLAFMEQSMKHRIKWNIVKDQKKQQEKNQFQTMTMDEDNLVNANKEHPDVIRSRDLKALYGTDSAQIHAMETAMQLSFDRISTLHQPTVWPVLPLKLYF